MDIEKMRIPVFVSCPSDLSPAQESAAQLIKDMLDKNKLAWRALGRSDYSYKLPLTEVLGMIRHCSGGVILGFTQFEAPSGVFKPRSPKEEVVSSQVVMPTPWNHLEAGVLFNQKLPILIFREEGIKGGVFDIGTPDVFIQKMPIPPLPPTALDDLDTLFQNWAADVKKHYYGR
jgi:hypothetical protein